MSSPELTSLRISQHSGRILLHGLDEVSTAHTIISMGVAAGADDPLSGINARSFPHELTATQTKALTAGLATLESHLLPEDQGRPRSTDIAVAWMRVASFIRTLPDDPM